MEYSGEIMVNITQEILGYINNNVVKDSQLNNIDAVYCVLCFALGVFIIYLVKSQNSSRVFNKLILPFVGIGDIIIINKTLGVLFLVLLGLLLIFYIINDFSGRCMDLS